MVDSAPALDTVRRRPDELPRATAHRGGMALGTENTLATFGRSVALGVRNLETDVRVTRDGHVVCIHDRTLARIADPSSRFVRRLAGRRVEELTLAQLQRIPLRGREQVCTLGEAIEAYPGVRFIVDVKDGRASSRSSPSSAPPTVAIGSRWRAPGTGGSTRSAARCRLWSAPWAGRPSPG